MPQPGSYAPVDPDCCLDLKPGKGCEPDSGGEQLVLLRAYITKYPGTIWKPVDDIARALGFATTPPNVLAATVFQHTAARNAPPSKSKTCKSLAQAIVARDFTKFVPGADNTDWRKHLTK